VTGAEPKVRGRRVRGRRSTAVSLAVVVGLAALAVLAACGDDDDSGDGGGGGGSREDYVEAFVDASDDAETGVLSADEEQCFAESLVDAVGVERLAAAVSPDEIRDRGTTNLADLGVAVDAVDGGELYDRISQCADVRMLLIQSSVGTEAISDAATQCFEEELSDDLVRQFMVAGLTESSEDFQNSQVFQELRTVFADCSQQ